MLIQQKGMLSKIFKHTMYQILEHTYFQLLFSLTIGEFGDEFLQ